MEDGEGEEILATNEVLSETGLLDGKFVQSVVEGSDSAILANPIGLADTANGRVHPGVRRALLGTNPVTFEPPEATLGATNTDQDSLVARRYLGDT